MHVQAAQHEMDVLQKEALHSNDVAQQAKGAFAQLQVRLLLNMRMYQFKSEERKVALLISRHALYSPLQQSNFAVICDWLIYCHFWLNCPAPMHVTSAQPGV